MRKSSNAKKMVAVTMAMMMVGTYALSAPTVYAEDDGWDIIADDEWDMSEEDEDEWFDEEDTEEEEITLSKSKLGIKVGQSSVLDVNGDYDSVEWYSSNPRVAKVNSSGRVIGLKPGKATITAEVTTVIYDDEELEEEEGFDYFTESIEDDSAWEDAASEDSTDSFGEEDNWNEDDPGEEIVYELQCKVVVSRKGGNVRLNATNVTLKLGKTKALKVKGSSGKVTWKSRNKNVATVNKGKVRAWSKGRTVILAKTGGKILRCAVTVKK